jgi:hypothetical protein
VVVLVFLAKLGVGSLVRTWSLALLWVLLSHVRSYAHVLTGHSSTLVPGALVTPVVCRRGATHSSAVAG